MKIIKWIVIVLVVLVAAVVLLLTFRGGQIIKQAVNTVGPQVLGVDVQLDGARFHPFRGEIRLSGLMVGNPEGFHTDSLFDMQHLEIDLDVKSLFTDTIVINRILIDSPQITYEVGLRRTNLGVLLERLESKADPDAPKDKPTPKTDEPGKNIHIKELILADARAQVSATGARGRVVPVQLSTIRLTDLGGEDQSMTQIVTEVVQAIVGAVGNAVAGAGDLRGDGLKSALEGAGALGAVATDGVRAVTDATGEGARALTGAAGEGGRAVTGAVDGAARSVRGMLGGGTDKDKDKNADADKEDPKVAVPEVELPDDEELLNEAEELIEEAEEKIERGVQKLQETLDDPEKRERAEQKIEEGTRRLRGLLGGAED